MNPLNAQSPEKRSGAETIDIQAMFATFQGEGPFCGHPAFFIRLAGCNLQCPGCDTDYTSRRQRWALRSLLGYVREEWPPYPENGSPLGVSPKRLVVITGGEPMRQNIAPLIMELSKAGYEVQIETNGTLGFANAEHYARMLDLVADLHVHFVCSPKTGAVHEHIATLVAASYGGCFKYVLSADRVDPQDGLPTHALAHPASPRVARPFTGHNLNCAVYVQPEDTGDADTNARNLAAAMRSCQTHGYILCIQVHKYIGVP